MLENKLKINNEVELAKEEEKITKLKALELFDKQKINDFEIGTFNGLSQIHKYLFQDIYDFAGKVRENNISKGNFRFASSLYLKDILQKIDNMPEDTFNKIIEKYIEMNIAHPFREGNGRSTRIWLDMERSLIKDTEIKLLLESALIDASNDRLVYMKGIDASYNYEGYNTYSLEELDKEINM